MPNYLVFYHILTKIAGGLPDYQGGTTNELEPETLSLFYKSYPYNQANPADNFRIQHPPNTRVIEVTKRHLENRVVSPLLTIRKNIKRKESKYGSGGNYS